MIISRSGRATASQECVCILCVFLLSFLSFSAVLFAVSCVCLMCVSWKINTAKLRKINKCQRSTRSLSHLTIITLIWDMLTNLLCPHLRHRLPENGETEDCRERCSAHRLPTGLPVESQCFVLSSGTALSSTEVSLCCVLC